MVVMLCRVQFNLKHYGYHPCNTMAFDWDFFKNQVGLVGHFATKYLAKTWDTLLFVLSISSDYIDKAIFHITYNEPDIRMDRETGDENIMHYEYRIAGTRYRFFRQASNTIPRVNRILNARLIYSADVNIGETVPGPVDVTTVLRELAGPFQDFHGQSIRATHLLDFFVTPQQKESITNAEWIRNGVLEVVVVRDHKDVTEENSAKWQTKTFDMTQAVQF